MAQQLRRFVDDGIQTWRAMPKSQALRWYRAVFINTPTILRERKFYAADRHMHGKLRFYLLGRDFNIDLDTGNGYSFLREFFVRQIYFREFKHLCFDTCLDLGCNIGRVSGFLRELAGPNGKVVGVDPLLYPDSSVRSSVLATPGVQIHQGIVCGESMRHDSAALHAMCDLYDFDVNLAITIQELRDIYDLKTIDFLKMDIEGAEFNIFRDSVGWLNGVNNFAMEVHHAFGDPGDIVQKLQQAGFRVKWLDDNGYPVPIRQAGYIYASRNGSLKD
jgi:FkbM family methyltransferase